MNNISRTLSSELFVQDFSINMHKIISFWSSMKNWNWFFKPWKQNSIIWSQETLRKVWIQSNFLYLILEMHHQKCDICTFSNLFLYCLGKHFKIQFNVHDIWEILKMEKRINSLFLMTQFFLLRFKFEQLSYLFQSLSFEFMQII